MSPDDLRDALDAAFPAAWRDILRQRVPFYRAFDEVEQERFEDKVQHFVLTKTFTSRTLEITDEMRVVVAAAACRLTLNLSWVDYASVRHVELRGDDSWDHDGGPVIGTGSRWKVTLSWPNLLDGMVTPHDGDNVGFHEFAHALDEGHDSGAHRPPADLYTVWTDVISEARADIAAAIRRGVEPALDPYAAKSDAELFAVATEWFFERSHDLRDAMPALFALLRDFYQQDPSCYGAQPRRT
ncbi:MAG TPA: zinc-dependent peptidase [Kofleriaceae bacterium]